MSAVVSLIVLRSGLLTTPESNRRSRIQDLAKPLDTVQMSTIASIVAHPDEPLPPHSFKALLKDGQDEWLFYGDDDEQKELLIEGLRIAAGL